MRLALSASALVHVCIAAALLPGIPQRPGLPAPAIPARLVLTERPFEPPVPVAGVPPGAAARQPGGEAAAPTRPVPELPFYSAGELDVLPRLLAALDLQRLENAAEGADGIRVVLRIDERGFVKDVEISAAGRRAREALRAELAAARFAPALKEGRAVRSRIVLDFRFAAY